MTYPLFAVIMPVAGLTLAFCPFLMRGFGGFTALRLPGLQTDPAGQPGGHVFSIRRLLIGAAHELWRAGGAAIGAAALSPWPIRPVMNGVAR